MTTMVKDLLKKGLPPTRENALMTRKHTSESIKHDFDSHLLDHAEHTIKELGKLHVVDASKSHNEAKRLLTLLDKVRSDIEACVHKGGCK